MNEPLTPSTVKKLVVTAIGAGKLSFHPHAKTELANDKLTELDALVALRGGVAGAGEFRSGTWRYPVSTRRMTVIIAFTALSPEVHVLVVTCFAHRR